MGFFLTMHAFQVVKHDKCCKLQQMKSSALYDENDKFSNFNLFNSGQNCQKEKVPFSPMNISLLAFSGCFFLAKSDFWPVFRFLAKRKNGHFSVIPTVVNVGNFFR